MTVMATDHHRVKSLLTETVKLLCKSTLTYTSEFSIEGLIAITIDRSEVVLVSFHEAVASDTMAAVGNSCGTAETLAGTTSVILVTPDTAAGLSQFVEVGGILHDSPKIVVETAQLPDTASTAGGVVGVETAGDAAVTHTQAYPELEAPQASLFTTAELDAFIDNCPSAGIMSDASCDVFAEVAITSESPPDCDKQLAAGSITVGKTDVSEALLLPADVDDTMPSCLSWDDDLADIGPLNLAGPQDLSLQLDKKVVVNSFFSDSAIY